MHDNVRPEEPARPGAGNTVLLIVSWLVVGGPLFWGVLQTARTSLPLFGIRWE
jgi:hypothetical protein